MYRRTDDVDEYIRTRRREGARRSEAEAIRRSEAEGIRRSEAEGVRRSEAEGIRRSEAEGVRRSEASRGARRAGSGHPEERARARELLVTDFFWSDLGSSAANAAPSRETLTRAWDDAIDSDDVDLDEPRPRLVEAPRQRASASAGPIEATVSPLDTLPASALAVAVAREPVRRTVVITGRGAERYVAPRRSYDSQLRRHERAGFKPDRVAMWAVLLGLALLLAAATSSHAAVLHAVLLHAAHAAH